MTTLTHGEQKKLAEKINGSPVFLYKDRLACGNHYHWNPDLLSEFDSYRSQALAVLEAYAKTLSEDDVSDNYDIVVGLKIVEALRTGNLDPIARELIE